MERDALVALSIALGLGLLMQLLMGGAGTTSTASFDHQSFRAEAALREAARLLAGPEGARRGDVLIEALGGAELADVAVACRNANARKSPLEVAGDEILATAIFDGGRVAISCLEMQGGAALPTHAFDATTSGVVLEGTLALGSTERGERVHAAGESFVLGAGEASSWRAAGPAGAVLALKLHHAAGGAAEGGGGFRAMGRGSWDPVEEGSVWRAGAAGGRGESMTRLRRSAYAVEEMARLGSRAALLASGKQLWALESILLPLFRLFPNHRSALHDAAEL